MGLQERAFHFTEAVKFAWVRVREVKGADTAGCQAAQTGPAVAVGLLRCRPTPMFASWAHLPARPSHPASP